MFAHDEYLSGMATVALAVLMLIAMFWIRNHMTDDVAGVADSTTGIVVATEPMTLHTVMTDATGILPSH